MFCVILRARETRWIFDICLIQAIEDNTKDGDESLSWYMKVQWLLYNISLPASVLVTLVYWGLLAPLYFTEANINLNNFTQHAFNVLLMLIEFYLAALPTRLLHAYQPLVYVVGYGIFSILLYEVDGTILYPYILDWSRPGLTIACICGLMLYFLVAQLVFFLIYIALKICVEKRGRGSHLL